MSRRRTATLVATVTAAMALLLPSTAAAQTTFDLFLSTDTVVPGAYLEASAPAGSCDPGDLVSATVQEIGFDPPDVNAEPDGSFVIPMDLPDDMDPGVYTIVATCPVGSGSTEFVAVNYGEFTDIVEDSFYQDSVAWAAARDITTGYSDSNQFQPEFDVSRAQAVTFLWRTANPQTTFPTAGFSDVVRPSYYDEAVDWAAAGGITTGVGGSDMYQPERDVTRAEFVTFLWRAVGSPDGFADADFDDTIDDAFYEEAVDWAAATGVTTGYSGGDEFRPELDVTRAQAVTFLQRAAQWAEANASGVLGPASLDAALGG